MQIIYLSFYKHSSDFRRLFILIILPFELNNTLIVQILGNL